MTRKGVHPYQYMDSFKQFQEPQLPPKDAFYSSLTEEDISEIDYTYTQRVFNHLDMTDSKTFFLSKTFSGLPLQVDIKMAEVELDLLTDIDQHLSIKEGIRGGVAIISHPWHGKLRCQQTQ